MSAGYRIAIVLASIGAVIMAGAIAYGFAYGNGWAELIELINLPWGLVSLIDVYVGFALFSGWVIYREVSPVRWLPWVAAFMLGGNMVTCGYAVIALVTSKGRSERFWMGRRAAAGAA